MPRRSYRPLVREAPSGLPYPTPYWAANDPQYGPLTINLPSPVGLWYRRWFARLLGNYGVLSLGQFVMDQSPSVLQRLASDIVWETDSQRANTTATFSPYNVPIFSAVRLPTPSVPVVVPSTVSFAYENPASTPAVSPQLSLESSLRHMALTEKLASMGLPQPVAVLSRRTPPRWPRERNRRRKDEKVPGFYSALLAGVNRTYGPVSEYLEMVDVFNRNRWDPFKLAVGLAINQAFDRAIGEKAQLTKRHIYDKGYWPFPVGYSTLSRLWR